MRHTKENATRHWLVSVTVVLLLGAGANESYAKKLRVAVVPTVIENTLGQNLDKLMHLISRAKERGCRLVIFPECALSWSEIAVDHPTRADMDVAVEQIGQRARCDDLYVAFCAQYRPANSGSYRNRALVYDHGGDDGRPDLRWIRYRPWAVRTGAYVIVCNPVHADTDFMGHSPWGRCSAIIKPDGSIQANLTYERDVMIVDDIDLDEAARTEAKRRRNHPLFKPFWDMGANLLNGQTVSAVPV